jgi:hypothetical protein
LVLFVPATARGEWQIKPFFGVTFGGATTLTLATAVGRAKPAFGFSGEWLGEVVGVEVDVAHMPGFFDDRFFGVVTASGVTTYTANLVVALPRRIARYSLRPYVVVGAGLMRAHLEGVGQAIIVQTDLTAIDVGGGVTGFLTDRIGVSWDLRHFASVGGGSGQGSSIGPGPTTEQLSFWRASIATVFRF